MTSSNEPTVESLRAIAAQAGLPPLSDDEANTLLRGVKRNRAMAEVARTWVSRETEPAPTFAAGPPTPKQE